MPELFNLLPITEFFINIEYLHFSAFPAQLLQCILVMQDRKLTFPNSQMTLLQFPLLLWLTDSTDMFLPLFFAVPDRASCIPGEDAQSPKAAWGQHAGNQLKLLLQPSVVMFLAYVRAVWNRGSQLALFFHPAVLHSYSARLPHGQSPLIMTCAARLFQCCLQLVKIPPPPLFGCTFAGKLVL